MAFRSNTDALLARAEALERENRALREEIIERDDLEDVKAENEALRERVRSMSEKVDESERPHSADEVRRRRQAKRANRDLRHDNRQLRRKLGHKDKEVSPAGLAFYTVVVFGGLIAITALLRACAG